MPKSLFTVLTFVKINTRRFFRDRLAIFFSVIFPVIFLFVFGSFNSGNNNVSFRVALLNQSGSSFAKNFVAQAKKSSVFKIDSKADTLPKAKDLMTKPQLDATIILPSDFGAVKRGERIPSGQAQVVYTQNNAQSGA